MELQNFGPIAQSELLAAQNTTVKAQNTTYLLLLGFGIVVGAFIVYNMYQANIIRIKKEVFNAFNTTDEFSFI